MWPCIIRFSNRTYLMAVSLSKHHFCFQRSACCSADFSSVGHCLAVNFSVFIYVRWQSCLSARSGAPTVVTSSAKTVPVLLLASLFKKQFVVYPGILVTQREEMCITGLDEWRNVLHFLALRRLVVVVKTTRQNREGYIEVELSKLNSSDSKAATI